MRKQGLTNNPQFSAGLKPLRLGTQFAPKKQLMALHQIYQPEMSSTSDFAVETIRKITTNSHDPILVYCDRQTAGRGQRGRVWESTTDSLTFTWCIQKRCVAPSLHPLLSLAAGLTVCSSIRELSGVAAQIKWPNDVLIDLKKAAGILVERITAAEDWFLIGIGINVNQTSGSQFAATTAAAESPTPFPPCSLRESSGREIDKQELMQHIAMGLQSATQGSADRIIENCNQQLALKGRQIQFRSPTHDPIDGKLLGIDAAGHLQVDVNGKKNSYFSGSIVGFE